MAAPVIDLYTGDLPLRSNAPTFNTNQEDYLTWEVPMIGQMNTSVDFVNTKADEVVVNLGLTADNVVASADNVVASADNVTLSSVYADNSAASASFYGSWSGLTGAASKPFSAEHNGYVWLLLNNLPDITISEPGVSSDWFNADSTKRITNNRFLHFYRNR